MGQASRGSGSRSAPIPFILLLVLVMVGVRNRSLPTVENVGSLGDPQGGDPVAALLAELSAMSRFPTWQRRVAHATDVWHQVIEVAPDSSPVRFSRASTLSKEA